MGLFKDLSLTRRTLWFQPQLDDPAHPANKGDSFKEALDDGFSGTYEDFVLRPPRTMVRQESEANLVASLAEDGMHYPVIDIDVPVELVPSKTEGHSHLYVNVAMTWDQYRTLLRVMVDCGIVERNYLAAADAVGMTYVRLRPEERPVR